MKYLLFYPDGTTVQKNELSKESMLSFFDCNIHIFRFENNKFFELIDVDFWLEVDEG